MRTQDAIRHFGNLNQIRKALGYSSTGACYRWGEIVPAESAIRLHELTKGEIPFRPSDYAPSQSDEGSVANV